MTVREESRKVDVIIGRDGSKFKRKTMAASVRIRTKKKKEKRRRRR